MSPLRELTLARLRLFFREPGAVFWTFGFPLLLSVALGIALKADKVEFYKDVEGVCAEDPKKNPETPVFEQLSYEEALAIVEDDALRAVCAVRLLVPAFDEGKDLQNVVHVVVPDAVEVEVGSSILRRKGVAFNTHERVILNPMYTA